MARERPFPFVYPGKQNVRSESGFTIMELVAVMVIVAILAVSAVSCVERRSFDAAGFADEVRAQLAYGQKIAVASRRAVIATVAGNTVTLMMCPTFGAPCDTSLIPVASPQGEPTFVRGAPKDVTITPDVAITFNPQGAPDAGAALVVNGGVIHTVTIEAGTGYVH